MKNIRPTGLKGKEVLDRMKNLMGNAPINENHVQKSKVEISKLAPDNKVYAIIRENHEYYIKTSDKIANLVLEDFNYIGGLKNKKDFAHESYAKALKQLNLKMISLNEQFGGDKVNVFENDNLVAAGGTHNFDYKDGEECEECVQEAEFEEEDIVEEGELKVKAIQDGPKELKGNSIGKHEDSTLEPDDAPNDKSVGTEKAGAETATPKKTIKETRKPKFSILNAMEKMDSIFESAGKKKVKTLRESLNEIEMDSQDANTMADRYKAAFEAKVKPIKMRPHPEYSGYNHPAVKDGKQLTPRVSFIMNARYEKTAVGAETGRLDISWYDDQDNQLVSVGAWNGTLQIWKNIEHNQIDNNDIQHILMLAEEAADIFNVDDKFDMHKVQQYFNTIGSRGGITFQSQRATSESVKKKH